ncbi:PREDICTED: methionine aminopeptidase 1-like [Amphimedon queenslandica]|uniref:Methionine aminopeptidase n=1 Tax=Amphimedon queenslandica TaxID=400682 RepID=A0A1X7T1E4_AMPQE|nr:PREDICTED: methionine aminopeptidase 1-like [Amphimedon queenslandica]|eukprot:XP_011408403.1 PREDICTED: methionine aminopeptidase 1-like [Amphimedon queenslandica]
MAANGVVEEDSKTKEIEEKAETEEQFCQTEGCDKPAALQCPTCIKLSIAGSFFCSQDCFKGFWGTHKLVHKKTSSYNPWPSFKFTGPLRPAPVTPTRSVPSHISRPDYSEDGVPRSERLAKSSGQIKQLSPREIKAMRKTGRLGREVLDIAAKAIRPGVTTDEIDRIVHEACIERNCYPSPLNYCNFPKSCCTSVNEVICHGIPDKRELENGDICNVDITVYYGGFHGDLNETMFVGKPSERAQKIVTAAYECMMKGIGIVRPGTKYRDVGAEIQSHAHSKGFSVVRSYCGHGINQLFHTVPNVPHYAKNKAVGVMKAGHTFTIEPMISEGVWHDVTWPDNWTAVTSDGKLSAQFEHTLLVTESGFEILTLREEGGGRPHYMDQLRALV